jgi:hypothetical protein
MCDKIAERSYGIEALKERSVDLPSVKGDCSRIEVRFHLHSMLNIEDLRPASFTQREIRLADPRAAL